MHPNPGFRKASRQQNIDFARHRSFGTLALNAEYGPLLSHIPFVLAASGKLGLRI
jgi:transcriptional regulator